MKASRFHWLTLALAVLLLLPGLARAAPERISPDEYRGRLQRAIGHYQKAAVEQARAELGSTWEVTLSPTPVTVDLRPVHELVPVDAVAVLQAHLQALDAALAAEPADITIARGRLNKALDEAAEQQRATNTLMSWFSKLLDRLFGGGSQSPERPTATETRQVPWLTYVALAVGATGIGVLGWNLWRSLAGNAAGSDAAVRGARRSSRPDRPLTPDELRQLAGEEAAAGDYKEGLRLAHLALLQHLDRSGLLRYVPAQTNREHEWSLRRKHPDLARTMHQLNDLVESRLYSGHGATAEDYRRGEALAQQLWREGDVRSTRNAQETTGASSSASSS